MHTYRHWLCAVLTLLLFADVALAGGPTGPRLTWAAFQHFWNKTAPPSIQIRDAAVHKNGDDYTIVYGYGTSLHILMDRGGVRGVSVRFLGGKENDAGGPLYLRLAHQIITVGSFRWPEEKIREARQYFAVMSQPPKELHYQNSWFRRAFTPGEGWEFRLEFMPVDKPQ